MFGASDDVQEEISGSGPVSGNTMEASTLAIGDHVYEEDLSGVTEVHAYLLPGNDFEEEISGTTEVSTFAIDEQIYKEDLSGITEVVAELLPGNDVEGEISGPVPGNTAEASTFDIDEQIYGIDLSGVARVPAYLFPSNDVRILLGRCQGRLRRPAHLLLMNRSTEKLSLASPRSLYIFFSAMVLGLCWAKVREYPGG